MNTTEQENCAKNPPATLQDVLTPLVDLLNDQYALDGSEFDFNYYIDFRFFDQDEVFIHCFLHDTNDMAFRALATLLTAAEAQQQPFDYLTGKPEDMMAPLTFSIVKTAFGLTRDEERDMRYLRCTADNWGKGFSLARAEAQVLELVELLKDPARLIELTEEQRARI